MQFLKKWRFLIIKLIYKILFKYGVLSDCWVKVFDKRMFNQPFFMKSCQFKDQIACNILKFDWVKYEEPMGLIVASLTRYLPARFIDIGANTGFYSLIAAASGARGVLAFEPVPSIFNILSANVLASGLNVQLRKEAIAEKMGQLTIYLPHTKNKYIETSASLNGNFRYHHAQFVGVEVISLDALKDNSQTFGDVGDCLLVKIDVESYELPVIKGASEFIAEVQPIIMIELLKDNLDREEIYALICAHSYQAFSLAPSSMKKINQINVESASDNYLFIPDSRLGTALDILISKGGLQVFN